MKVGELRSAYLEFFRKRGHRVFPSDSLVPVGDASLLFTGAGMNQFKPYFLGQKKDVTRAASCQKCLRTADLERVGKTEYHHSFFEMLGNFSFGDYFKKEAIVWGWEFVTQVLKIPEKKLWVSVYENDPEARDLWRREVRLDESKIIPMGPVDNFWPSNAQANGPNGPCGPCSEIYAGEVPGKGVEIWNLVFTQFDRQSDGSLVPLPQKNIDTGMGLERTASVLQGVKSNFDIDSFQDFRRQLKKLLKSGVQETVHENAVMDHVRAAVFSIADGALPSNEGRGYVIRKLIRLACDHLEKSGCDSRGHLNEAVAMVASVMAEAYPEIKKREKEIASVVKNEEMAYADVLKTRIPVWRNRLKEIAALPEGSSRSGKAAIEAFTFYDSYGVPLDLLQEEASQEGVAIDKTIFDKEMQRQKNRSRESSKIGGDIFAKSDWVALLDGVAPTKFLGYETLSGKSKLLAIVKGKSRVSSVTAHEECVLVFEESPFYAEAGGQIGDTGAIRGNTAEVRVLNTQAYEKIILHEARIEKDGLEVGEKCALEVDQARRSDIMKNHTATHLLHSALRKTLGDHVKQSGSLVAADYLRFDFTHFKAVDPEVLSKIEALVNAEIQKNTVLSKKVMSKEEALHEGAIAFFGEKYGDQVRVVSVGDFSKELCGGTHLKSAGEIELFRITSESSIQSGVRRIEAVTGRWAKQRDEGARDELTQLAGQLDCSVDALASCIQKNILALREQCNRLDNILVPRMRQAYEKYLNQAPRVGSVKLFDRREPDATPDLFMKTFIHLKNLKEPFVVLWQCEQDGKVTFVVGCSDDLAAKGFHSGRIVKDVSQIVEGSGGGRPEYAVGGGKRIEKAGEAMAAGKKVIVENLTQMSVR